MGESEKDKTTPLTSAPALHPPRPTLMPLAFPSYSIASFYSSQGFSKELMLHNIHLTPPYSQPTHLVLSLHPGSFHP